MFPVTVFYMCGCEYVWKFQFVCIQHKKDRAKKGWKNQSHINLFLHFISIPRIESHFVSTDTPCGDKECSTLYNSTFNQLIKLIRLRNSWILCISGTYFELSLFVLGLPGLHTSRLTSPPAAEEDWLAFKNLTPRGLVLLFLLIVTLTALDNRFLPKAVLF